MRDRLSRKGNNMTDDSTNTAVPGSLDPGVRRRRVIYISELTVLGLLTTAAIRNQFLSVPLPLGLPETARVVGVWSDWTRNAFAFVVEDASFDEVPAAVALPEMQLHWHCVEVELKSPNDQAEPLPPDGERGRH